MKNNGLKSDFNTPRSDKDLSKPDNNNTYKSNNLSKPDNNILKSKDKIWSVLFVNIMAIGTLASIISYSFYNILPSYTAGITNGPGAAGFLSAVFAATAGAGRLVSGRLTDRWGRFNTLLTADLIFLIAGIMPIIYPGFWVLLIMRLLQGLAFALILTAVNAAVADIVPPSRLGEGFGYYGMGFAVSIAVGPAVAMFLLRFQNPRLIFIGTEFIVLLTLFLSLFCKYEKDCPSFFFWQKKEKRILSHFNRTIAHSSSERSSDTPQEKVSFFNGFLEPGAFLTAFLGFIYFSGVSFFSSYTALYAQNRGIAHPDLFFLCGAVTILLSRLTIGRLLDRCSPIKILLPAIGVFFAALELLYHLNHEIQLAAAGLFFGVGVGIVFPLLNTLSIRRSSPERKGAATSTFALGTDTGFAFGTLLWGFVGDSWGYDRAILGVCLVLVFLIIVACLKFRDLNRVSPIKKKSS